MPTDEDRPEYLSPALTGGLMAALVLLIAALLPAAMDGSAGWTPFFVAFVVGDWYMYVLALRAGRHGHGLRLPGGALPIRGRWLALLLWAVVALAIAAMMAAAVALARNRAENPAVAGWAAVLPPALWAFLAAPVWIAEAIARYAPAGPDARRPREAPPVHGGDLPSRNGHGPH